MLKKKGDSSAATSGSYLSSFPTFNNSSETSLPRGSDEELHVFGAPLDDAVAMTRLSESDHIPGIVRRCIEYLDECGTLHHVRLFFILLLKNPCSHNTFLFYLFRHR